MRARQTPFGWDTGKQSKRPPNLWKWVSVFFAALGAVNSFVADTTQNITTARQIWPHVQVAKYDYDYGGYDYSSNFSKTGGENSQPKGDSGWDYYDEPVTPKPTEWTLPNGTGSVWRDNSRFSLA